MTTATELHQTTDATVWADEWLRVIADYPAVPTSRDTMIGWFANAIMAGYDEGYRQGAAGVLAQARSWI